MIIKKCKKGDRGDKKDMGDENHYTSIRLKSALSNAKLTNKAVPTLVAFK
jgi:hypothetical protein